MTHGPSRIIRPALAVAVMLAHATATSAGGFASQVSIEGCESLDEDNLQRLVDLEINSGRNVESDGATVVVIAVECGEHGVRIIIADPLTRKRSERVLPDMVPNEVDPDRVVALAASQLLRVSWLELVMPVLPETLAPPPADEAQPRRALISVEAGARVRALGNALFAGRAGLGAGGGDDIGWNPRGMLAFEYGSASREIGLASVYSFWAGLGLIYGFALTAALSFEVGVDLAAGLVLMSGESADETIITHDVRGFTGEIAGRLGPVFPIGEALRLALVLEGGYTLRSPIGRVEGDNEVTAGGPFVGLCLRLGFLIP